VSVTEKAEKSPWPITDVVKGNMQRQSQKPLLNNKLDMIYGQDIFIFHSYEVETLISYQGPRSVGNNTKP